MTQHIPDKGEHLVRYYGWYSHRRLGIRTASGDFPDFCAARGAKMGLSSSADYATQVSDPLHHHAAGPRAGCVSTWAMLIKRVYEVDPLVCPECGSVMKIISFIERGQHEVIERILRHCGLWVGAIRTLASARPPPRCQGRACDVATDLQLVPDADFLEAERHEPQPLHSRELQLVLDPEYL